MISKETIRDIIDAAQIEQVVGDFVQLKKRGSNLLGLCPFHNEKTPSFTVSPSKGIYKCFGCGKAGNSVNFIMEHEKYSYPEALKYLANKYNIEIEEHEPTPEEKQADTERESLFSIHTFARDYFSHTMLNTEEGKAVGHTYFLERGFREDIIQKFQLGYSTSEWDGFTKHALAHGYKEELLVSSGLTLSKEGKLYDRFRERVIFPIHNLTGKVIGFGGRILTSDKTKPKYVNSPESEIYNKSKSLYGIFYARASIVSKDNCYLVEGYTDVISLHQAGIENVVASSGTSLTTEQIKLISKFTKNITILYDGDPAGIKASFRGIDMILEQGMNVRIVLFPDGEDPDSYARKHRSTDVEAFIATSADDFIAFKARLLLAESNNDPIKKASLIHEIIESISLVGDPIIRSLYIKECASIMGMGEATLLNELNKLLRKKFIKSRTAGSEQETLETIDAPLITIEPEPVIKQDDCSAQEYDVIRLLLLYGDKTIDYFHHSSKEAEKMTIAQLICNDLRANQVNFDDPVFQEIFTIYAEGTDNNQIPADKDFFTHADQKIATAAIDIITPRYELSPHWEDYRITVPLEEERLQETSLRAVLSLLHRRLTILINNTQKELKELPPDTEEYADLMSRNMFLLKARNGISNRLGRVLNN
ncbi:MAG TPA: DNA primase [Lentimicrobium sp.]|nr:DNA primase [Lentimicrobium sp.]